MNAALLQRRSAGYAVPPSGLDLGPALGTMAERLTLAAMRAELRDRPLGELPATAPANCRSFLKVLSRWINLPILGGEPLPLLGFRRSSLFRWSIGKLHCGPGRAGDLLWIEDHRSILVAIDDREIGVRAQCLCRERGLDITRLDPGEAALPGAEANEDELVLLAALELKGSAMSTVRKDAVADLTQRERSAEPAGVGSDQLLDEQAEETAQLLHP